MASFATQFGCHYKQIATVPNDVYAETTGDKSEGYVFLVWKPFASPTAPCISRPPATLLITVSCCPDSVATPPPSCAEQKRTIPLAISVHFRTKQRSRLEPKVVMEAFPTSLSPLDPFLCHTTPMDTDGLIAYLEAFAPGALDSIYVLVEGCGTKTFPATPCPPNFTCIAGMCVPVPQPVINGVVQAITSPVSFPLLDGVYVFLLRLPQSTVNTGVFVGPNSRDLESINEQILASDGLISQNEYSLFDRVYTFSGVEVVGNTVRYSTYGKPYCPLAPFTFEAVARTLSDPDSELTEVEMGVFMRFNSTCGASSRLLMIYKRVVFNSTGDEIGVSTSTFGLGSYASLQHNVPPTLLMLQECPINPESVKVPFLHSNTAVNYTAVAAGVALIAAAALVLVYTEGVGASLTAELVDIGVTEVATEALGASEVIPLVYPQPSAAWLAQQASGKIIQSVSYGAF